MSTTTSRSYLSVASFNVWGEFYWPARRRPLGMVLEKTAKGKWDLMFMQETTDAILDVVVEKTGMSVLGGTKLDCLERFSGSCGRADCRNCHGKQGDDVARAVAAAAAQDDFDPLTPNTIMDDSIVYNDAVLELLSNGTTGLEPSMNAHRRLHWAIFKIRETGQTILGATAHLTYTQHPRELTTSVNPRIEQSKNICKFLDKLAAEKGVDDIIFAGDLNDGVHPALAFGSCGYHDPHHVLGINHVITWPWGFPIEDEPPQVLDFMFFRSPGCTLTPLCITTVDSRHPFSTDTVDFPVPSDHKPIHAMFLLGPKKA